MPAMHELLAVEKSVVGSYNRDLEETKKVMGRADLFTKSVKRKEFFDDEEAKKFNVIETKDLTTTVKDRLTWFQGVAVKFYDLVLKKDLTNQQSKADILVDGATIAKDVPATTLLMLESRLNDLRGVLEASPTLPAGFIWELDHGTNLYHSREPKISFSSKRVTKPVVLYEATKEHPAQVKEVSEDIPVAKITEDTYSGMLTSKDKATLLSRLDLLLQGVHKARQRANSTNVVDGSIGKNLFDFLFKDVV